MLAAAVVALVGPAVAEAAWSPARTLDAARNRGGELAVNGRGDAVVLWESRSPARLRVTLLPAHRGSSTHTLSRDATGTVALDERGRATAAWIVDNRLYAAHGSVTGRWSAPQLIARGFPVGPLLAVSPRGRVLLVWTDVSGLGSTGVAWRVPGHRFSSRKTLHRPAPGLMPGEAPQSDVGATFDALDRAYVWGTCDGVVRVTRPHSRHLKLVRLTSGTAVGVSLAVTGSGRGLASWVDSKCSSDPAAGSLPGPVRVRALRSGTFGPPVTLTTGPQQSTPLITSSATHAIALAGDGNLVTTWEMNPPSPHQVTVSLDARGALGAVTPITGARIPFAADARGNLGLTAPFVGFVVRPRRGAEEPFDKGGSGPNAPAIGAGAAVAANGQGFGVIWDPDLTFSDHVAVSPATRLSVSLWRP